LISGVAFLGIVGYVILELLAIRKGALVGSGSAEVIYFSYIVRFPLAFWLLALVTTFYYSTVFPFQSLGQCASHPLLLLSSIERCLCICPLHVLTHGR
jgi:hypothetical protein